MISNEKVNSVLEGYKLYFPEHWSDERYKWGAVKWFQENWDVDASDFAEMLDNSLSKTDNLLTNANNFPKGMIVSFAQDAPEEVRSMFIELFDENRDVYERISTFKDKSADLLDKYGNGVKSHYQNENAISTYLWLRYPDKYYIYKYKEAKEVALELEFDYKFKKGAYADNIRNFLELYDELNSAIKEHTDIVDMFKSNLNDMCYPDPELKTLTIDVGFYLAEYYINEDEEDDWFPQDYSPELGVDDWLSLLSDGSIFTTSSLEIMKRMKDYGGAATCKQLSVKYGENPNFYNGGSWSLAQRIAKKTGCPVMTRDTENARWWPILYLGRPSDDSSQGAYIWKLRDELSEALDQIDLSGIKLYADNTNDKAAHNYWWLNANPKIWSYSDIQVGEDIDYTFYNENGHKRRIFQNFLDAKPGDYVIGYESYPVKQIVALCRVSKEQVDDALCITKLENLASPIDYSALKECPELENMEYFHSPQGSLFKLTEDEYNFIMDIIRDDNPISQSPSNQKYSKEDFLDQVYMSEERYEVLVSVLKSKKNIILQGAPGVGKTFTAKRLAYSMMGEIDEDRIKMIQFHQNYSYEDFMMGYKPTENGFELKYGVFYSFCQNASNHPDDDYFFIIDEINRGNLSKIFGELLMLIEKDYRGTKTTLAYNGMSFSVPENLYIIGMMNTADRSLAMIDYALRRRFSFFEMMPGFNTKGFKQYQKQLNDDLFDDAISVINELNVDITKDRSLGKGCCIGHSYFCGKDKCTEEWLRQVMDFDIIPMIEEYWFDDEAKFNHWKNRLQGIFDD